MERGDPFPKLNLLLADDDKDDCLLFKEAMEELQLPITLATVHNGEQLMENLEENTDQLPDVLFLDLNMPRKNGFTCLEEIKSTPRLKQLPIIIISTSFDKNIAEQLYNKGAQYYICKPADFTNLKIVIHEALTRVMHDGACGGTPQPSRENFVLSAFKSVSI